MTVQHEDGAPQTELKTSETAIIAMLVENGGLTAEELVLVAAGADIHIILKVANANGTITAESKAQIESAAKGYTIGQYLDISLFKRLIVDGEAGELVQITGTHDSITISVQVPDDLKNTDSSVTRTFWIVRNHDGAVDFLPTIYDAQTNSLTFETDKFSDYAIVYQDTVKTTEDTENSDENSNENTNEETKKSTDDSSQSSSTTAETTPKTGDNSYLWLWLFLLILSCGIAAGAVIYHRQKGKRA